MSESVYGEPWKRFADSIYDKKELKIFDGAIDYNGYTISEDYDKIDRVCKLLNLFAGVSDEQIDKLAAKRNTIEDEPIYKLLFSLLTSDLADVPLAMLIDAIQNTREYQKQLETYRTWQEMHDKLLLVKSILNNSNVCAAIAGYSSKTGREVFNALQTDLNLFFDPLLENNLAPVE